MSKNLVWLESNLDQTDIKRREHRLSMLSRSLSKVGQTKANSLHILESSSMEQFVALLLERGELKPSDPDYLHAILLPKIWTPSLDSRITTTLGDFGQPNERLFAFDVAQQVSTALEKSEKFQAYKDRPMGYMPNGFTMENGQDDKILLFNGGEHLLGTSGYQNNKRIRHVSFQSWIKDLVK